MLLLLPRLITLALPLAVIVGLLVGFTERQALYDWWRLRDYDPPKSIEALADDTKMTKNAEKYFYVNHPDLVSSKTKFQELCTQTEQTIVLGCYHGPQRGIYIYNVSDARLDGIEEVTAAHEMLHAAYDRLDDDDRKKVDSWLQDYYRTGLNDARVKKSVDSYKKTEPDDIPNEMHSIFATEVRNLPSNLENYYKRYFSDRSRVVSLSERYEATFANRKTQAKALLTQLKSLESQIKALEASLSVERQALEDDRDSINSQAQASAYNSRVRSYNAQVNTLNGLISQYNQLRDQYNELVLQSQELIKSIDTRVKTESTR